MWRVSSDNHLLYNECVYVVNDASLQTQVISRYHNDEFAGHFSHKRTAELTQWHYNWLGLSSLIKEYCKNCIPCQKGKSTRHRLYETLNPLPPPQRPWGSVMMNFITDLPLSKAHNRAVYNAILITLDRLIKMAHYELMRKTIDTPDMAGLFIATVVQLHGCPDNLIMDWGTVFVFKYFNSFCFHLWAQWNLSTVFHPQTDSQTERQNQTVEAYLWMFEKPWAGWLSETSANDWIHL